MCEIAILKTLALPYRIVSSFLSTEMSLINYTLFQRINSKAMNPPDGGFDPEALSEEIRQCNYDLAHPKSVQRHVCSYTTKHCYKEINAELEYLKEEGYDF